MINRLDLRAAARLNEINILPQIRSQLEASWTISKGKPGQCNNPLLQQAKSMIQKTAVVFGFLELSCHTYF